jgi:outer membrane protein assembly factor BamB
MPTLRLVADDHALPRDEWAQRAITALLPLFRDAGDFPNLRGAALTSLVRDLGFAVAELSAGKRERVSVLADARSEPSSVWEVGLDLDHDRVLVSVFKRGREPQVAQTDRAVAVEDARAALLAAIAAIGHRDRGLELAQSALAAVALDALPRSERTSVDVAIEGSRRGRLVIAASCRVRAASATLQEVSRADLHALLFRGTLSFEIEKSVCQLRRAHVFLVAEQLARFAADLLHAHGAGHSLLRRANVGEVSLGVRLDERGQVGLIGAQIGDEQTAWRSPLVAIDEFVRAVVSFGRRLTKRVLVVDGSQRANLRISTLRRDLAHLSELVDGGEGAAAPKLNGTPESYRAFAESHRRGGRPRPVTGSGPAPGKLRFNEQWRADVPGVDLRSLAVAGGHLLIGSARELACIERDSGRLLWTRRTPRAVSILTPAGLARLGADGRMWLCDVLTGETIFETQLSPTVGASASGAVVGAPGLPRMLLVGDGPRHLAAIDLDSHEMRWRRALRPRGAKAPGARLRLRRAGKLMVATAGDSAILAFDLLSGEVVWRHIGDHRFVHATIDGTELYALGCENLRDAGPATLERLDPWSGALRWRATLPRKVKPVGPPILAGEAVLIVTADEGNRTGVLALDRGRGDTLFDKPGGLSAGRAAAVVVDDLLVANSDAGELSALDIHTGASRYRHVFGGDRPHCLNPVLRSGALFVPQSEVFVVRPRDGAVLGRIPSDLVPDALRVDERCGVYLAEASGYVAAYQPLPMLSLVPR